MLVLFRQMPNSICMRTRRRIIHVRSQIRILCLLRHAEAESASAPGGDLERPLTVRGFEDAAMVGQFLRAHDILPDLVMCSDARRARQTLEALALGSETQISHEKSLYGAGADGLLSALRSAADAHQRLLLIGHNPSIQALAIGLAGRTKRAKAVARAFRPATLAVYDAPIEAWRALGSGMTTLRRSVFARDLADTLV